MKNVQSIMTDEREQLLLEELSHIEWDICLLNETWREKKEEIWTSSGHMFMGSGGTPRKNGVAILLHRRWTKGFMKFQSISEKYVIWM